MDWWLVDCGETLNVGLIRNKTQDTVFDSECQRGTAGADLTTRRPTHPSIDSITVRPPIYPPTNLTILRPFHQSIFSSICPRIRTSSHPYIHSLSNLSNRQSLSSVYQSTKFISKHWSMYLVSIPQLINPSIYPFTFYASSPLFYQSISPGIHMSMHPYIHLSSHQEFYPPIDPSLHQTMRWRHNIIELIGRRSTSAIDKKNDRVLV